MYRRGQLLPGSPSGKKVRSIGSKVCWGSACRGGGPGPDSIISVSLHCCSRLDANAPLGSRALGSSFATTFQACVYFSSSTSATMLAVWEVCHNMSLTLVCCCRLNWVVLTAWNVGCLPIALILAACKARARVRSGVLSKRQPSATVPVTQGRTRQGDQGLVELGEVALLGA